MEQQLNIEKGKLISKKILTLINEQDVQFQTMKMAIPKVMPDGFSRSLQQELNLQQDKLTVQLREELLEDRQK